MEAWTGKTVKLSERNGYDDSDFYVTYWNGEKFVEELYGTTRYSFMCEASIDAPEDIKILWRSECESRRNRQLELEKAKEALNPTVGKRVKVIGGKKYKNIEGIIFWRGINKFKTFYKNGYSDPESLYNQVVGVKMDTSEKFFISADQVVVI